MFTFKCPRIRNDRHPRSPIKLNTIDFSAAITKKMNILRKVKTPIYPLIIKKNMRYWEEIMIPRSNYKLDIRI